jgi:DNA helicase-2/ATP-dependent DNA helicase PcrA
MSPAMRQIVFLHDNPPLLDQTFLNELNDAQREAVLYSEGPSLVIAGAGSGKTRVLTYRIAHLLNQGVKAYHILALTFTNKAASSMKERIATLVGQDFSRSLWMGTFHSIFARILRTEGQILGYSANYTIYDTLDSKSVIKNIIRELKFDEKAYPVGEIFGRISSAKNNLITPQAYASNADILRHDAVTGKSAIAEIYKIYVNRCRKADAMDFDDLLLNTNILLRDFPDILAKYQKSFQYILVDEYQDTNYAQYLIVNKLAAAHHNVCVVGDDAQSIYSFRGAKIENILNFRQDYPNCRLFKLEQNYRSTKTIVDAANSLIAKNKGQIHKNVWSDLETGEQIKLIKTATDGEEGFVVANSIMDLRLTRQANYLDFAILYRTNAQSRIFEESLRKKNIPYKVYGSLSFYQRKEIKDLLAYFRFTLNSRDDESLRRIINYPARGIGDSTLDKITGLALDKEKSFWEVIRDVASLDLGLNKGILSRLAGFVTLIEDFRTRLDHYNASELAMHIASVTGILKELNNDKSPEGVSRHENIQELINSIGEFVDANKGEGLVTLNMYLESVALLTDQDTDKPDDKDKVSVMTLHAAKGLEFPYVYLAGLEEDLFPNKMSVANPHDLEEERRLFYVGLTRAKKQATITYAETRYKWGVPSFCQPSRFLRDIDAKYIDVKGESVRTQAKFDNFKGFSNNDLDKEIMPVKPLNSGRKLSRIAPKPVSAANIGQAGSDIASIREGMIVSHERFGKGRIVSLEGESPNIKATVDFDGAGKKQLLLKFAKLKIVG